MFTENVKKCLNLTKVELQILEEIIETPDEFDCFKLSAKMGLDNSTLQRCLKKLVELGLVKRRQINLSKGGYQFKYVGKTKMGMSNKIIELIEAQTKKEIEAIKIWSMKK